MKKLFLGCLLVLGTMSFTSSSTQAQCFQNGIPCGQMNAPGAGNGAASVPTGAVQIQGTNGSETIPVLTDSSGRVITNVNTLPPIPTGTNTIGSISNTSFGATQSGTWTVNLGTLNGAATASKQDSLITALGTPFQAGGTIGNTAFGISGLLPAFATTPTFNIGTAPTLNVVTTPAAGATTKVLNDGVFVVQNTASIPSGTNTIGSVIRSIPFSETTTPLAGSATFTPSTPRDSGTLGVATPWNTFSCFVRTDQTGTLNMQGSNDNSTWYTEQSQTIAVNVSLTITNRIFTRYHRCQVVNTSSTAQTTLFLNSQLGE